MNRRYRNIKLWRQSFAIVVIDAFEGVPILSQAIGNGSAA